MALITAYFHGKDRLMLTIVYTSILLLLHIYVELSGINIIETIGDDPYYRCTPIRNYVQIKSPQMKGLVSLFLFGDLLQALEYFLMEPLRIQLLTHVMLCS